MALNLRYRVFLRNVFAQSLLLWCCSGPVSSKPLSSSMSCNPRDGKIGNGKSIMVRVERFDDTSVNFRKDKPRLLSTVHRTMLNDGKMYFLDYNLKAKFHGREVCFSTLKETILNEKGADESRLYSCEHVCLEVGKRGNLVTNSSSGGRVWPGQSCCVWNRKRFFKLTPMKEGPKCLSCQGRECLQEQIKTKQCTPGDKCVAITLNKKQNVTGTNSSIKPIILGCSSSGPVRGYTCQDGCQREVKLVGSGTSKVCVRCCTGNECNRIGGSHKNETQTAPLKDKANNSTVLENGSVQVNTNVHLMMIAVMVTLWFFQTDMDL